MAVILRTAVRTSLEVSMPGQFGSGRRWDDDVVNAMIDMVDGEVRQYCGLSYTTQTISLADSTAEYELDDDLITIYSVEYSSDGATYNHVLHAASFDDIDSLSRRWRDDTTTRPTLYTLFSAVGIPQISGATTSKILVYPKMSTAGSSTIKITGASMAGTPAAARASQWAVDMVYVPRLKSILIAGDDEVLAAKYYDEYLMGLEALRVKAGDRYTNPPGVSV